MASEKTLHTALTIFSDQEFRDKRRKNYPETNEVWDARAATFAAMDSEGRFDDSYGHPMTAEEKGDFEIISEALLKMSN